MTVLFKQHLDRDRDRDRDRDPDRDMDSPRSRPRAPGPLPSPADNPPLPFPPILGLQAPIFEVFMDVPSFSFRVLVGFS